MTKEEIIHRLQYARHRIDNITFAPDVLKAIDIAIETVSNTDTDTISRQAAIETVMECYDNAELFEVYEEKLRELPPAQPERIKGRWIKISPANIYECSECGKSVMTNDICAYDFCHGCGADMREVTT